MSESGGVPIGGGEVRRSRAEWIEARAERIIRCQGLMFALAMVGNKEDDTREARKMLKDAIIEALIEASAEIEGANDEAR
jgi:hypothetical protein